MEIEFDDGSHIMMRLMQMHEDIRAIRALLEEEDDGEEATDDDSGS